MLRVGKKQGLIHLLGNCSLMKFLCKKFSQKKFEKKSPKIYFEISSSEKFLFCKSDSQSYKIMNNQIRVD